MPTYDYRCPNGHQFEVFQRISAGPGAECPDCGEDSERMISGGAGLIFKGEGFYITDHRSEDYKKKALDEGSTSPAKSSESRSSSSSEAKQDDKTSKAADNSKESGV